MKRYLAIPGALLLITAFVRATVNLQWDAPNVAIAAAGAAIVVVTIVWNRQEVIDWLRDPRGVFAVTTGISVAVFVALLVLANIAVWYNPWSVDMTASGRNEVSEEARDILSRLDQPVVLRQFGRASSDPRLEQLLQAFARETPRVRVDFADIDRDRGQAAEYGVVQLGEVVVLGNDAFRKVEQPNEQALITAILQVTSEQAATICFPTGHGERGLADTGPTGASTLADTLEASNYPTEAISLLEGEVPESCAAVVIAGARQPYDDVEMDRLTAYADRSGRIAILLEPDPLPSFADWLRPRGIVPGEGSIVDVGAGQVVGGGPRTAPVAAYRDHPVTRDFNVVAIFEGARPLDVVEQPEYGGRPAPLALTGSRSFASAAEDPAPAYVEGRDTPGPLTLAAATAIGRPQLPEEQARLVVFGDSDFVSNALLRRSGNRDLFFRGLAWLIGEQEATIVSVAPRENRRLELTERMRAWMYIVNLGLLPLIPVLAGIIVYLRSRR